MDGVLKCLLEELIFGNMRYEIKTYVRNDNLDAAYRVGSANTATNRKRLNGFPESNRGDLEQNEWLIDGYIHWGYQYLRWLGEDPI